MYTPKDINLVKLDKTSCEICMYTFYFPNIKKGVEYKERLISSLSNTKTELTLAIQRLCMCTILVYTNVYIYENVPYMVSVVVN